jgi:nitroreductase
LQHQTALEVLLNRVSVPSLQAPAPSGVVLENIFRAAMRAADHNMLRPWRFLVLENEALVRLGQLFVRAAEHKDTGLTELKRTSVASKPHRAPMIIVAIARCQVHPKVPEVEQIMATGCAVQNMLNAAFAQGIGAMWRTGSMALDPLVKAGLGLNNNEQIVGFLYLGTPKGNLKSVPSYELNDYFSYW